MYRFESESDCREYASLGWGPFLSVVPFDSFGTCVVYDGLFSLLVA